MYEPNAFQIRFGGCKGMLAEAHPADLSGRKIAIRPSMKKFPCTSSNFLEIVKITAPRKFELFLKVFFDIFVKKLFRLYS